MVRSDRAKVDRATVGGGEVAVGDRVDASTLTVGRDAEVRRRLEESVAALAAMVDGGCFRERLSSPTRYAVPV